MLNIETTTRFDDELIGVLDFIAEDNPNQALKFYDNLMDKLYKIPDNPFMYRQRKNMDENTRELIFRGYTIPLYVSDEKKTIFILGIFNQNLWE